MRDTFCSLSRATRRQKTGQKSVKQQVTYSRGRGPERISPPSPKRTPRIPPRRRREEIWELSPAAAWSNHLKRPPSTCPLARSATSSRPLSDSTLLKSRKSSLSRHVRSLKSKKK